MGKINELLITGSEKYISGLMAEKLPEKVVFHNFSHTQRIGEYAEIIGQHAGLTDEEMDLLKISVLFKDSGFVNSYENHLEESVAIATKFLSENNVDQPAISRISELIRATRFPQQPKDKVAEVLCDADMMYITADDAIELFDLLYFERALVKPGSEKRATFEKNLTDLFSQHTYFTEYGQKILQPKKEDTIKRICERIKHRKLIDGKKETPVKKKFEYTRGVDTMFRITARNQINLNSIADNKSNILISVNAIIISIIITMLAGNIGNMSQDIVPILVLLVICLATIIIAILSTRPNIINSEFTKEDLENMKVDLTFFGNFIKIDYDEYLNSLKEMMQDDEHLYSMLIKNQYSLGKILSKKFRLVRIAYNVFMFGIIFTVLVFLMNYLIVH